MSIQNNELDNMKDSGITNIRFCYSDMTNDWYAEIDFENGERFVDCDQILGSGHSFDSWTSNIIREAGALLESLES